MKARQKWDLLVLNSKRLWKPFNVELKKLSEISILKNVKKTILLYRRKNTRFFNKISVFYYFYSFGRSRIYSFDAVFHTASNEYIFEHLT